MAFLPEQTVCHQCQDPLKILKTRQKEVATLAIGTFWAKETLTYCPKHPRVYESQALKRLVPARCTFAFDVMVYIGRVLFLEGRSEKDISSHLVSRNLSISPSEIATLGKKFIAYLAIAHQESQVKLKKFLSKKGGYILHLDGTCDGNSPHLITGLDALSEIILQNMKAPSEKVDSLVPFLQQIKQNFGTPVALVHDMGKGFCLAVETVFPGVPDFICHYHFLRDIGKDLFEKEYRQLKGRLTTLKVRNLLQVKARLLLETKKITQNSEIIAELQASLNKGKIQSEHLAAFPWLTAYVLIKWALETRFELNGYGFPFDQHHYVFYKRLQTVHKTLTEICEVELAGDWKHSKPLYRIKHFLTGILEDQKMKKLAKTLQERIEVFDQLRQAMRLAQPEGQKGLNDDGSQGNLKTIEQSLKAFCQHIKQKAQVYEKSECQKMMQQIKRYWDKLFADPITVKTPKGEVLIQPQRTNNILERLFRDLKRTCRKRTGMKSINKILKAILADTPLIKNLENPEYLKLMLNGKATLAERFAEIDAQLVRKTLLQANQNKEKLSPTLKKIVFRENLPSEITQLFMKAAA